MQSHTTIKSNQLLFELANAYYQKSLERRKYLQSIVGFKPFDSLTNSEREDISDKIFLEELDCAFKALDGMENNNDPQLIAQCNDLYFALVEESKYHAARPLSNLVPIQSDWDEAMLWRHSYGQMLYSKLNFARALCCAELIQVSDESDAIAKNQLIAHLLMFVKSVECFNIDPEFFSRSIKNFRSCIAKMTEIYSTNYEELWSFNDLLFFIKLHHLLAESYVITQQYDRMDELSYNAICCLRFIPGAYRDTYLKFSMSMFHTLYNLMESKEQSADYRLFLGKVIKAEKIISKYATTPTPEKFQMDDIKETYNNLCKDQSNLQEENTESKSKKTKKKRGGQHKKKYKIKNTNKTDTQEEPVVRENDSPATQEVVQNPMIKVSQDTSKTENQRNAERKKKRFQTLIQQRAQQPNIDDESKQVSPVAETISHNESYDVIDQLIQNITSPQFSLSPISSNSSPSYARYSIFNQQPSPIQSPELVINDSKNIRFERMA